MNAARRRPLAPWFTVSALCCALGGVACGPPAARQAPSAPPAATSAASEAPGSGSAGASSAAAAPVQGATEGPAADPAAGPASDEARARALDPELTQFEYPFPVAFIEVGQVPVSGERLRMAYMDVRPERPNGRVVVLLHGKNFSGAYWEPTVRALLSEGYRVVVPDQVGFGKSSKPRAFQFSFHALAAHTSALLEHLAIPRAAVVGHSMGGMLAVRFALAYPAQVEKLALINPIGLEDWQAVVPYRSVSQLFADELRATPESIRSYQQASYYDGQWSAAYEQQMAIQAGWTRHPEFARVAWCAALTTDMIFTQPVVHDFPRLRVPTLLVIGQRDRTALGRAWAPPEVAARLGDYPVLGRKAAAAIRGAQLVELPGIGHLPQVEAFGAYRAALSGFLR